MRTHGPHVEKRTVAGVVYQGAGNPFEVHRDLRPHLITLDRDRRTDERVHGAWRVEAGNGTGEDAVGQSTPPGVHHREAFGRFVDEQDRHTVGHEYREGERA